MLMDNMVNTGNGNRYFDAGKVRVAARECPMVRRRILGRFLLHVPAAFSEDPNLAPPYTYLFSRDQSPLGIALKYAPAATEQEQSRLTGHYFGQPMEALDRAEGQYGAVLYRETTSVGGSFSIYSLRFSVAVPGGFLFGCFNCAGDEQQDWRQVVLEMLKAVEEVK